ncbi:MAG TPA: PKD domain-containing protein [Bacteroidia bacterium]|jgi:PKD repeat protein|nr:PKD domain-containing protein [Bacteroidia bacterium]
MKTKAITSRRFTANLVKVSIQMVCLLFLMKSTAQTTGCDASFKTTINKNTVFFNATRITNTTYYDWNFGDGTSEIGYRPQSNYHTYKNKRIYKVCLTIRDTAFNCFQTLCDSIKINEVDCAPQLFWNVDKTDSRKIDFGVYLPNDNIYSVVNFGDGASEKIKGSGVNYVSHIYSTGGEYKVCITNTDSINKCLSTLCDTVSVTTCTADFTYTYDIAKNTYTFFPVENGSAINYFWFLGNSTTSTLKNPTVSFTFGGMHTVGLITSSTVDKNCHDTIYKEIRSDFPKNCKADFNIKHNPLSTNQNDFTIENTSIGNNLIFTWDFGDKTAWSSLPFPSHTYMGQGPYTICLRITNPNGCSDYHCDTIKGDNTDSLRINIIDKTTVGIKEHSISSATLENYPNPFSERTTIHYVLTKNANVHLTVYDLLGNKIELLENTFKSAGDYKLDWQPQGLPPGIYILQLKAGDELSVGKVILQD